MPAKSLVTQPSFFSLPLHGAYPRALNRFSPLRTLVQREYVSSPAHAAASNTAVFEITPTAFSTACHVSPRAPLVSPCAGSPGARPSVWLLSGVLWRVEISAPMLTP